ncbi:MAG: acyltransferase family protein [Hyphomonadaceae bacterium]
MVLGALWVLWPFIALAGGLGFSLLTGLAALLLLPVVARSLRPRLYFVLLVAFFIYTGVTVIWSPRDQVLVNFDFGKMQFAVRSEMLRVGLQILALGGLIGAALRLDDSAKARVQRIAHVALFFQLLILVVLTVFEAQILQMLTVIVPDTGEGVQNISRNCLIMAAATPLLAVGIARGRSPAVGALLILALLAPVITVLVVRDVQAGILSIAFAGACMAVVHLLPRSGFKLLSVGLAGVIMSTPWLFGFLTKGADFATADSSSSYRAAIWNRVITVINEHPLTGSGLGVLRTIRERIESGTFTGQFTVPNHPHSMMLQLWAETGAIGASLLSLAIVFAGWRMPDQRTLGASGLRAAAVAGAMVAIGSVSFELWNDWWWAVGGVLAVLAVSTPGSPAARARKETGAGLVFGDAPRTELASSLSMNPENQFDVAPAPVSQASPSATSVAPEPIANTHTGNNFNLLRLLFALMVVVYHAIALPGIAGWENAESWTSVGAEIGVQGFFVLSGYLVWASLERSSSLGGYVEKRVRRLLPGYVTVVLVCAIAAVVLVPALRSDLAAVGKYVGWNLTFLNFMAPSLPGVFEANRFTEINGALWTLKIEVMFYLILPVLALVLRVAGSGRWIAIALIYVAAEAWRYLLPQQGGAMVEIARQLPGQMSFFITGIALYAWRDDLNWRSALAPFGAVLLVLSMIFPQAAPLRAAGLGIVAVWLAVGIPRLFDAARFGDLSYGLYIVHFPIIQCVIAAGLFATPSTGFAVAGGASLAAALLLWWLVERPALRRDSAYRTHR